MRAAQLSSVARQTGEARRVHVNPRVDYIAGRGAHKIQRGHQYSSWAYYSTPRAWSLSPQCDWKIKQRVGRIFLRDGALGRSAAIISAGLIFALSFGNPVPLSSFLCSLGSGTTADCLTLPIPNFGLIGTLPKHQFLGPSPTGARCSYFGHTRILVARCDENLAQSTKQSGRCAA
jgi:hypothetical protein